MKYAFFKGCKIPPFLEQYGTATRAVMKRFGVKLVDLPFNCCGYPNRDISFESFVYSAARNMALAEKKGLSIVTPCKCCYGSLRHAAHFLREDAVLRQRISDELKKEGLSWTGVCEVKHVLTVLRDDVGLEAIKAKIVNPQPGLVVAAHYGCHALRPGPVMQFDDPLAPTIFEELIAVTGARTVDWPRRLDCCGNPLLGKNDALSLALMRTKVRDAAESGAQCLCTACTYCQIQFDQVQAERGEATLPAILYMQLLGLAMGVAERHLGISRNYLPYKTIQRP